MIKFSIQSLIDNISDDTKSEPNHNAEPVSPPIDQIRHHHHHATINQTTTTAPSYKNKPYEKLIVNRSILNRNTSDDHLQKRAKTYHNQHTRTPTTTNNHHQKNLGTLISPASSPSSSTSSITSSNYSNSKLTFLI